MSLLGDSILVNVAIIGMSRPNHLFVLALQMRIYVSRTQKNGLTH